MTFSPAKMLRAATRRWIGPFADSRKIVKVTVRDENFRVVRELTSERDVAAFRDLWSGLTETDPRSWPPPATRAHYKLDIRWARRDGRSHGGRWLYHPGGYVNLVAIWRAIWVAPLYRTPIPGAFEALLRTDASAPDQVR